MTADHIVGAMHRPRLLFVAAFPPPGRQVFGGNVTDCRRLLDSSFPTRFELDLLDSTQISNPAPRLPIRLLIAMRRFAAFVFHVERHRPAAVLLFVSSGASVVEKCAMAWYARLRRVPAVLFPRGGRLMDSAHASRSYRNFLRLAFRGGTMMFCQSPRWQSFAVQVLGFAPDRAPVIPSWTATDDLLELGRRRESRRGQPLRLLFVGWLERGKGVLELIAALADLRDDHSYSLDFVGDGALAPEAQSLVRGLGLSERVRFRGWLSGADLREAFAEADIFVLPSWAEGLPNAMIEAFAAKLAVVVTPVGGIPDVVSDGVHALLVPPRDVNQLRDALARIMSDPHLRSRLAEAGFTLAESTFSTEAAVARLASGLELAMNAAVASR